MFLARRFTVTKRHGREFVMKVGHPGDWLGIHYRGSKVSSHPCRDAHDKSGLGTARRTHLDLVGVTRPRETERHMWGDCSGSCRQMAACHDRWRLHRPPSHRCLALAKRFEKTRPGPRRVSPVLWAYRTRRVSFRVRTKPCLYRLDHSLQWDEWVAAVEPIVHTALAGLDAQHVVSTPA